MIEEMLLSFHMSPISCLLSIYGIMIVYEKNVFNKIFHLNIVGSVIY